MNLPRLVCLWLAEGFYRWALREISPLHPDVPRIVLRRRELADKAARSLRPGRLDASAPRLRQQSLQSDRGMVK